MGITEWIAVLTIFAVIYGLIKRYETRLVLIGAGLFLCLISWNLIGGLNAFAKAMTNSSPARSAASASSSFRSARSSRSS